MVWLRKRMWEWSSLTFPSTTQSLAMSQRKAPSHKREEAPRSLWTGWRLKRKFTHSLRRYSVRRRASPSNSSKISTPIIVQNFSCLCCYFCSRACPAVKTSTGTSAITKSIFSQTQKALWSPPRRRFVWLPLQDWWESSNPSQVWILILKDLI